jgi:tetratricopeptide (TPR) repeat protein
MMLTATIVLIVSLVAIVVICVRKIPQLRVINVESIQKEKHRATKEEIILQKLTRKSSGALGKVTKHSSAIARATSKIGRRTVQKLYAIEQSYQKLKRVAEEGNHAYDKETVRKRVDEAEELMKQEEFIQAEKIFIDIISHNPKSVDAYEGLGNLYRKNTQLEQARETLAFSLKLAPNDASVLVALAELELDEGQDKKALEYLRKAVKKRSKNPRYLDYYIEASLRAGSLKDAREGIRLLRAVNPENKKLEEFSERFEKIKAEYIAKMGSD